MRLDAKELYGCNSCGGFAKPLLGYARTYAPAAEPAAEPRMRSMAHIPGAIDCAYLVDLALRSGAIA